MTFAWGASMRMNRLMAALGIIAAMWAGAPASWAQSGRPEIAGHWEGGFSCRAGPMGVSLTIEEAGAELRARFRFFPTRDNPRAPEGDVEMSGRFDRTVGSFELKPTRWIKRARGFNAGQMAGLLEGGKLSGQIRAAGCGGFTLVRAATPSVSPKQAAAAAADRGPVSLREAATLEQSCGVLLRWARQLKQEYPDIDLMHTPLNQVFPRAVNLYRDKYFVPVFGKPFVNTTPEWRRELQVSVVRKCSSVGDVGPALREFRYYIERPFNLPKGDFSFAQVSERLGQIALLETWADRVRAALPGIPETAEGFRQLQEYLDKGQKDLAALWPSERAEFVDKVRARQTELARRLVAQAAGGDRAGAALPRGRAGHCRPAPPV